LGRQFRSERVARHPDASGELCSIRANKLTRQLIRKRAERKKTVPKRDYQDGPIPHLLIANELSNQPIS